MDITELHDEENLLDRPSKAAGAFTVSCRRDSDPKHESVLCLVVIVSDKHCHADECQQEFQGDDKNIVHNGKEFY